MAMPRTLYRKERYRDAAKEVDGWEQSCREVLGLVALEQKLTVISRVAVQSCLKHFRSAIDGSSTKQVVNR